MGSLRHAQLVWNKSGQVTTEQVHDARRVVPRSQRLPAPYMSYFPRNADRYGTFVGVELTRDVTNQLHQGWRLGLFFTTDGRKWHAGVAEAGEPLGAYMDFTRREWPAVAMQLPRQGIKEAYLGYVMLDARAQPAALHMLPTHGLSVIAMAGDTYGNRRFGHPMNERGLVESDLSRIQGGRLVIVNGPGDR